MPNPLSRSNDVVVRVDDLQKCFPHPSGGEFKALDGVSFTVERGETFGLLGPNGAGKTTALEILEGIQQPTQGEVELLGFSLPRDTRQIRGLIGVQLQSSAYPERLRLHEILELLGAFYGLRPNVDELLDRVGLREKRDSVLSRLSGGQIRRFSIAASVVNDPRLLFLDEPTSGLDPQARRDIWRLIEECKERGITVIITTHYMDEAQALCDRLAIIDSGTITADGTPDAVIRQLRVPHQVCFSVKHGPSLAASLRNTPGVLEVLETNIGHSDNYEVRTEHPEALIDRIRALGGARWTSMQNLRVVSPSLEDAFLRLTDDAA